jgi:hypothetical protein
MKMYEFNPLTAAALITLVAIGVTCAFVIMPIAFIQWLWNGTVPHFSSLPQIAPWQAGLLYLVMATLFCLSGIIKIEIHTGPAD